MQDPGPLRDEINNKTAELFEFNQRIGSVLRSQAKDFEAIGAFYSEQMQRAYAIAALIVEMAVVAAENTGDLLAAEFGVSYVEEEGEDAESDRD